MDSLVLASVIHVIYSKNQSPNPRSLPQQNLLLAHAIVQWLLSWSCSSDDKGIAPLSPRAFLDFSTGSPTFNYLTGELREWGI